MEPNRNQRPQRRPNREPERISPRETRAGERVFIARDSHPARTNVGAKFGSGPSAHTGGAHRSPAPHHARFDRRDRPPFTIGSKPRPLQRDGAGGAPSDRMAARPGDRPFNRSGGPRAFSAIKRPPVRMNRPDGRSASSHRGPAHPPK